MLEKCFLVLCGISFIFAFATGNIDALANAVIDGASKAVTLTISLIGMMTLWCGIMEALKRAGAIQAAGRALSPILRRIFPNAWRTGEAKEEITLSVAANLLGLGNAATPAAVSAMAKMQSKNKTPEYATDDMVTLTVLGASGVSIMPTTVIALRRAADAAAPYSIIVPVWICSLVCALSGVILSRVLSRTARKKTAGHEITNKPAQPRTSAEAPSRFGKAVSVHDGKS